MKALLSTDAYTLLGDGDSKIRMKMNADLNAENPAEYGAALGSVEASSIQIQNKHNQDPDNMRYIIGAALAVLTVAVLVAKVINWGPVALGIIALMVARAASYAAAA